MIKEDRVPNTDSSKQAWYMVGLLFLAYTISNIDRQILSLLVPYIQEDFSFSDTQMGALMGLAFGLTYAIAGLPIGYLADRKSRRGIIAIGISLWSLMTIFCGLAKDGFQLFAARMGVGIGEASLGPAALSLISDRFPPNRRAFAISVYHLGYPIGGGLALIIGGIIVKALIEVGPVDVWLIGVMKPWQLIFLIVGLPGFIVAALMFTFSEPERVVVNVSADKASKAVASYGEMFAYLKQNTKLYTTHFSAVCLIGLLAIGTTTWYPVFLARVYGLSMDQAGIYYGIIIAVMGTLGLIVGGKLTNRIAMAGNTGANYQAMMFATATKTLPLVIGPLMPTVELALLMMAIATFLGQAAAGVSSAAIIDITPSQMRAKMASIMFMLVSLVGIGGGAVLIGLITQSIFPETVGIRYSLAWLSGITGPIVILILWTGMPRYQKAIEKALNQS